MVMIVLDGRQFFLEQSDMMVVYQGYRPDDLAVGRFRILADKIVANQIAKRLGAIGVTALRDEPVELLQQTGVNRHAYSAQTAHEYGSQALMAQRARRAASGLIAMQAALYACPAAKRFRCSAQRFFCAAPMRLRAAALRVRLTLPGLAAPIAGAAPA